jgi:hypothetical protein
MQTSGSTTYFVSPSEIAETGQVAAQAPQLTHSSEITCAILNPPKKYYYLYGINPINRFSLWFTLFFEPLLKGIISQNIYSVKR